MVSLNNLGLLYHSQDSYTEAEPLHLEAINIFREGLGENHSPYSNDYGEYKTMSSQLWQVELR
ncbi:MAG: tetratricopeptide repeat protein [Microcystis sp. M015S2]|nr:tetratricopeptide repeat protein [Microcystis sp. M015S2]MCA2710074.1 tetratricopeptide repeat protein [Microcystis sp. M025S2]MCA2741878.1 tetratricopeptide repeat protein [Microcystis sp. M015S2]MCA2759320.1 tetratricopeptide repeat protein [Microcystis sp. M145S2]